ncbi:helix-turn-helix transcriptional regulator [Acinetobacter sp. WCHAc010052]|uniref:helix-turn-helix transcriptional regulator n=1 Tax=Acinetobacter sp. WCHAc010052 TaxID=2004647 RepID=UPI000B3BEE4E|nr:WYL domain-containing protein [Acinetobacter sp. WCHAc010052]AXY60485.1 WYL domain-containing protein [Acinetobacter sp. WCHAc010052]
MEKATNKKNETLANRLIDILTRLNSGEKLAVKMLAEIYSVHSKTIRRDLIRLESCQLPIHHEGRYFYLDPMYLGRLKLKDIQTFARISGIQHLYPNLDMSFIRELLDNRVYDAKGYFVEDASQFETLFEVFGRAIRQHQQIGFLYKGEPRVVEPYKLVHHHGCWYLAAVRKNVLRAYRLSRIKLSTHPHELFGFAPNQEIIKQLEDEESIWFGQEKFEVILTVHTDVALHFKQRSLLPEQNIIKSLNDGGLIISSRIAHHTQLLPLVRYWIPHIKIVSPEHLQDEMENELRDYLN